MEVVVVFRKFLEDFIRRNQTATGNHLFQPVPKRRENVARIIADPAVKDGACIDTIGHLIQRL